MKYSALSTLEETIAKTGSNGEYNLQPFSIPVKNENLKVKGLLATPKGRSKYYYDVVHPKQRVVLHFTAGNIRSDLGALTRNDYHVSVAFVIGRSGIIYQLFSSKYWSGHIGQGIGNTNTGNAQDKATIGIELSNYGYLTEKEGNLETYYSRLKDATGKTGPVDVYCSLAETAAYIKTANKFRDQSYYATHTAEQYDSLTILLRYLTSQYNIPRQFMPEPKRYETTQDVLTFKGIVSHVNYRPSGKWDIGPGFDWNKLIQGVQAPTYTALFNRPELADTSRSFESAAGDLDSEDQMEGLLPEAADASGEDEPYEEIPAEPESEIPDSTQL